MRVQISKIFDEAQQFVNKNCTVTEVHVFDGGDGGNRVILSGLDYSIHHEGVKFSMRGGNSVILAWANALPTGRYTKHL